MKHLALLAPTRIYPFAFALFVATGCAPETSFDDADATHGQLEGHIVVNCTPGETQDCSGNGVCAPGGKSCECYTEWWNGPTCAVPSDQCPGYGPQPGGGFSSEVCSDNGLCTEPGLCECDPGFSGAACEIADAPPTDACDPNPCNGGWCENTVFGFECTECPAGYTGATCADDIDECSDGTDDCDDEDTCVNVDGGFECEPPAPSPPSWTVTTSDKAEFGMMTATMSTIGQADVDLANIGSANIGDAIIDTAVIGVLSTDVHATGVLSAETATLDTVAIASGTVHDLVVTGSITLPPGAICGAVEDCGLTVGGPDNDTLYTAGEGLLLSGEEFSLDTPTPTTLGGVHASSCAAGEYATGIDANGDLQCDVVPGAPTDYPKTLFRTLTAASFRHSNTNLSTNSGYRLNIDYGHPEGCGSNCNLRLTAPVDLPDGAVVDQLRCYYAAMAPAVLPIPAPVLGGEARLEVRPHTSLSATTVAGSVVNITPSTPSVMQVRTQIFAGETIDNRTRMYNIKVDFESNQDTVNARFYGCRLRYQVASTLE